MATDTPKVFCYWGSWSNERGEDWKFHTSDIDPHLCTHAAFAFVPTDTSGIFIRDPKVLDLIREFVALKERNPKLKVLASIGGWDEKSKKFSNMAANSEYRANFIKSGVEFLTEYKFDGLDFAWDYPAQRDGNSKDYENYVILLREMHEAFSKNNLLLTIAVAAPESSAKISYDIEKIHKYVDFINLMCYDFFGPCDHIVGHNCPLKGHKDRCVQAAVEYWLRKGTPPEKLLLGIPSYGHTFTLKDTAGTEPGAPSVGYGFECPDCQEKGVVAWYQISKSSGWKECWDEKCLVPYAYKGKEWVSYENERSIEEKLKFLKMKKLGGVNIWSLEHDDYRGIKGLKFPLLNFIRNYLSSV